MTTGSAGFLLIDGTKSFSPSDVEGFSVNNTEKFYLSDAEWSFSSANAEWSFPRPISNEAFSFPLRLLIFPKAMLKAFPLVILKIFPEAMPKPFPQTILELFSPLILKHFPRVILKKCF